MSTRDRWTTRIDGCYEIRWPQYMILHIAVDGCHVDSLAIYEGMSPMQQYHYWLSVSYVLNVEGEITLTLIIYNFRLDFFNCSVCGVCQPFIGCATKHILQMKTKKRMFRLKHPFSVGILRLERRTLCSQSRCANQLRHIPILLWTSLG